MTSCSRQHDSVGHEMVGRTSLSSGLQHHCGLKAMVMVWGCGELARTGIWMGEGKVGTGQTFLSAPLAVPHHRTGWETAHGPGRPSSLDGASST